MQVIDVDKGVELYQGSRENYFEILGIFVDELQKKIADFKQIKIEKDVEKARSLVHKISGGAAYCAVPILQEEAKRVEEKIQLFSFQLDNLGVMIDHLIGVIEDVLSCYRNLTT